MSGTTTHFACYQNADGSANMVSFNSTNGYTLPDGCISVIVSGSVQAGWTKVVTFLTAGNYCVNGTWEYKSAGSTVTYGSSYLNNYVYYYDTLENPFA